MAATLDPKELVTLQELAVSNANELAALVAVLGRKVLLSKRKVVVRELFGAGVSVLPSTIQFWRLICRVWAHTIAYCCSQKDTDHRSS